MAQGVAVAVEWVPLNMNVRVRFKLTAAHQQAWEASQRRDLGVMYGFAGYPLEADAEGWVTPIPLWQYARAFGTSLDMGMCPISPALEMEREPERG